MQFVISCPGGCAQLVKNELKVLGYPKSQVLSPSTIQCEADESAIAKINLRSRLANKVYVVVGTGTAPTFERLFDIVHRVDRAKYINAGEAFVVTARSDNSMLTSTPALQSMGKKAISKKLTGNDERREENSETAPMEIMLSISNNTLQILLNTTGESLHRRGYRSHAGEAPLKENLAAALVLSAGRKFRDPLYDIMCGSGTILIEAALIAKNIAPGLQRYFAFEGFSWYEKKYLSEEIKHANEVIITDKEHTIIGSDIDPTMIAIAKENATNAGVADYIQFSVQDMHLTRNGHGCYLSNPPYGERMNPEDLPEIYETFDKLFMMPENYGGIITSYDRHPHAEFDTKTFFNGPDKVMFFKKIRDKK